MLRLVLDTNVLVSAVLTGGKPRQLLRAAIDRKVRLVVSGLLLDEFRTTISRPKFRMGASEVGRVVRLLAETAEVVPVHSSYHVVSEDPDDDVVLNTAVDGRADYVVSGDDHLLSLRQFMTVAIVTPSAMLVILTRELQR